MKKIISILTVTLIVGGVALAQTKKPTSTSFQSAMVKGKVVYTQYCLPCHQADGGDLRKAKQKFVLLNGAKPDQLMVKG